MNQYWVVEVFQVVERSLKESEFQEIVLFTVWFHIRLKMCCNHRQEYRLSIKTILSTLEHLFWRPKKIKHYLVSEFI